MATWRGARYTAFHFVVIFLLYFSLRQAQLPSFVPQADSADGPRAPAHVPCMPLRALPVVPLRPQYAPPPRPPPPCPPVAAAVVAHRLV